MDGRCRPVDQPAMSVAALDKHRLSGLRRAGGVESGQAEAGLPVLRDRGAVRGHERPGRSSSSIWCGRCARCPTSCAAGRPSAAPCSARAARPSRSSIPTRVGQHCEFCGSPALVDYQEIKSPIRPQSLLPFKVSQSTVRDQIRRWYASKWLAPGHAEGARARRYASTASTFRTGRSTRRSSVRGKGRRGTTTTRPRAYRDNQGRTQTRQVQHVRWEPASGVRRAFLRRRAGAGHARRESRRCCGRSSRS